MTAPSTTTREPLAPLVVVLFTIAAISTAGVVVHGAYAVAYDSLPPQLMTVHAVTTVGLWIAGLLLHTKAPQPAAAAVPPRVPTTEPELGARQRHVDNAVEGMGPLGDSDEAILREIERRLWEIDE